MEWRIPDNERTYLRQLAEKQAEYAALPVMQERKQNWYKLNDEGADARPPVVIETWTFDRDFMPEGTYKCESLIGRSIESQLLRNIREHELIDDDKLIPDSFDMGWHVRIDELGVEITQETAQDRDGQNAGHRFNHPIKNLEEDLHILKPAQCSIDRDSTMEHKAFVEDVVGEFLPVQIRSGIYGCMSLTQRVVHLMGMEAFFMAMYDNPDEVHQLMGFLRDNCLRVMHWAETEGLLVLNRANQHSSSSFHFTEQLPAPGFDETKVRLCDMWGHAESQETVGVSPKMFHEFCDPYYRAIAEPLGKLYWGCCEPAHLFWDDISAMPHLKKVSISRWCDEKRVGEAMRGTDLVFSRKPNPNFLSVDESLDEEGWGKHIKETLDATKDVAVEFIVRDVYTLQGNINNARRAVDVARRVIDESGRG